MLSYRGTSGDICRPWFLIYNTVSSDDAKRGVKPVSLFLFSETKRKQKQSAFTDALSKSRSTQRVSDSMSSPQVDLTVRLAGEARGGGGCTYSLFFRLTQSVIWG